MKADLPQDKLTMTGSGQSAFNTKKIISQALHFWYLYVLSFLFCIGYTWFKLHYATPMYKVYGQVLVVNDKNAGGSAQALSGNGMDFSSLFANNTNMQNEIAILQTTDLCRKVVDEQKLYITYYNEGDIRRVELYNGSPIKLLYATEDGSIHPVTMSLSFSEQRDNQFTITIGKKSFPWHFFDTLHYNKGTYYFVKKVATINSNSRFIISVQDPNAIASSIAGNLSAALLSKSTILNLSYNTNLPNKGEDILEGIMQAYINRSLGRKNEVSDSTLQFIDERIRLVGGDLNNIENTIQRFLEQNKITSIDAQSQLLLANSNTYYQRLNDLEVQLQVIATMLSYIRNETNNSRPVPALLNSDPTFSGLVSSYNAAQVQRDKILLTLKNDNPIVSNLNSQMSGLRSDIITSLQSQQKALTISKNDLTFQNNRIDNQIRQLPSQERQFLNYSREQDLRQTLFLYLLQKREEIAIAKAANASNASVISSPKSSHTPYDPVPSTMYTIGIFIGFLLPTAFVVTKLMLNHKIESKEDITSATPVTILSEIGHNRKSGLINLSEEGRSMLAEQFRIFRTNMDFALSGTKSPVILITSTMSGEGKSFIAANLGQIYAISGKKVLLMELDLRKPKLSESLNINNTNGFSSFIVSDQPIENFIQPLPAISNNLYILSAGPIPPNPAELLLSSKTSSMMEHLRQSYDIIIVDTAPIGAVTDAQILSSFASVTLYILRQGYTTKNSFTIVNDLVINNKIQPLYLVINDIAGGSSYNYGYGYGYQYNSYGYHETDKEKKKWWQRNKYS